MLKNYFITAYRNLLRNKGFAFINVAGLAIGIVCTALIFLWVEDEFSFDSSFANRENLYIVKDSQTYDGTTYVFDATPGPLAKAIKTEIPGTKNTARCTWETKLLLSAKDKTIYSHGDYVDEGFLSMFSLEFVKGNSRDAFKELYSLVLTEKTANKFFGATDVIGKTIKIDNDKEYIVSGVVKDLPANCSLHFDWLAPFKIFENQNTWLDQWGSNSVITYVELLPNADLNSINNKLHNFVSLKMKGAIAKMSLYPMDRWRLYNSFDTGGNEKEGRIKFVKLFSLIAWIILIIACINFMNLATARSEKRAREVGVRKTLGSGRKELIVQFICESLMMAFFSGILAVFVIYLVLPSFNDLVQKQLELDLFSPTHFISLLLIILLCGLIAGSYPAFYLSSFNPIAVLKGLKINVNSGVGFIRKGLVVMQFSISVILIICTIIIYKQIKHVKSRDIGYQKEGLIYSNLQGNMGTHFDAIKNNLLQAGIVQNACLSSNQLLSLGSNTGDFTWQGKDVSKKVLITVESVSPEYISTTGVTLKNGRDFYSNAKADSTNIIINESLARLIGKKEVLGSQLFRDGNDGPRYTVIGVIKDFIYNSMYAPAQPMILFSDPVNTNVLSIRFKKNIDLATSISQMEAIIKKETPGYPFEYRFMDEQFDKLFKTELLIGKLAGVFATLAIFISCLGLFGLAAYMAERRTKEISIRKILGASVSMLTLLLSKDFLKLVYISCIIAFPLSGWFMHGWLLEYEYHIKISGWIFVIAGLSAMLIALITVGFQAIKAAVANPVKSLRTE
jgi:putative ABC transport system permease protein